VSTWSLHMPIVESAGKGTLFFLPCPGGAASQFAQTWNRYGRIVEMCRDMTCEMKGDDSGAFPQTCSRGVIMIKQPLRWKV
jgi:hypothetical protein